MINISLDISRLLNLRASDILTFSALVLAFLAYDNSIELEYKGWKSLLTTLQTEIKTHWSWLSSRYNKDSFIDPTSYFPGKIIFPLSFEIPKETLRKGIAGLTGLPSDFSQKLSLYNERIEAFNSLLNRQNLIVASDPANSAELSEFLMKQGFKDCNFNKEQIDEKLLLLKTSNIRLYGLATQIFSINRVIHTDIIGEDTNENHLNFLSHYFDKVLGDTLTNFEKHMPWYIRYKKPIVLFSISLFILLDFFFK